MVEALIEERFIDRTEARPTDYERAVVVKREVEEDKEDHPWKWTDKFAQKGLTGPTLLEISGFRPMYSS
jgi:hypothetical protein